MHAGNPLTSGLEDIKAGHRLLSLVLLNVSHVTSDLSHQLHVLSAFAPNVELLDLAHSGLRRLRSSGLFPGLKALDLRGCPLSAFSPEFMSDMAGLQQVL